MTNTLFRENVLNDMPCVFAGSEDAQIFTVYRSDMPEYEWALAQAKAAEPNDGMMDFTEYRQALADAAL